MAKKEITTKEFIEYLEQTAGTPHMLGTEYMESTIELNAKVYYLTEDAEDKAMMDEGFERDYSIAFYNDKMSFGIPLERIAVVEKGEVEGKDWVLFVITLFNGDVYRVSNVINVLE